MRISLFKPVARSLRKKLILQTVKACEVTSAAGALETGIGLPGAVGGPGRPLSVNVSAAECACH